MKRKMMAALMVLAVLCAALTGCGAKGPTALNSGLTDMLLGSVGETCDLSEQITAEGGSAAALNYVSSDAAVAEVSDSGVVTARAFGSAVITASVQGNDSVYVSVNVLVTPYRGVYTASKYIEAMGCEVRIRLTLNDDGSYAYYRYPMYVSLSGGGQMDALTDSGTYAISGGQLSFTGEYLGQFDLQLQISDGSTSLRGSVPTGGAATQMQLVHNDTQDRGESGRYTGRSETADGAPLDYVLTLEQGSYTLTAGDDTLSAGPYSFDGTAMEFAAAQGASFTAEYDEARGVVEGTALPAAANGFEQAAGTLQRG